MKTCRSLVVVVVLLLTDTTFAQTWQVPRLAWGDPDLQGTWTNATLTGLERFEGIDELVLSESDARVLERRDAEFTAAIDNLPDDLPTGDIVGGYNSAWLDRGTALLRVNGEARTSIIVEPASGTIPYTFTGWAGKWWRLINSQKRNNPEEQLLGDRCLVGYGSTGGPPMLPVLYNNNYQFVQTQEQIMILVEMNHSVRTIHMNGSEPLPEVIRPWYGESFGHWEGDTLVVRTTHFHPQQNLRSAIRHQLYMGQDSVVTERFTRTAPDEIHYAFTVEDPEIYRRAWSGELVFRPSTGQIYEYACHEGNYGMMNMLAGERASGTNGIRWLVGLMFDMPEEVTHPQLSNARFDQ
jgi:hypothetical protein